MRVCHWLLSVLIFFLAATSIVSFPLTKTLGKTRIGSASGFCACAKKNLDEDTDEEKILAKAAVKKNLDTRGLYVFAVVLLLNARFTFMPQEIRSIYTCPSGPNRENSIAEFKATNPDYVCNEPSELFIKYITAPIVPPPSGDLILAKPLMATKYGTGENL